MKILLVPLAIGFGFGVFFFMIWLLWLALGVVLPAFGVAAPSYWVVMCGWFILMAVAKLFAGRS